MSTTNNTIEFAYADYQADCVDELETGDSDLVVLRTGYGGGKSYVGAQWIHEGSMGLLDGSPGLDHGESLVLAPDFQKGGPATYRVFFETLPGEGTVPNDAGGDPENSPIVAGYNRNKRRVTYVSGHVVRLGSADKWNRYAGSEFHRIWMDEPSHYDTTDLYDLHEMLISRQRTQAGPNTALWTSTGNGFDQFYDITERQVTPDDDPLPWAESMSVIVESSLRNPFLPDDAKDKLRRQFEGTAREDQALHGGFAAAEGLVYSQFTRDDHVVPEDRVAGLVTDADPIYGYDAGWDHPRVLVEWRPTHHDQWLATDLYHESGKPFEHLCDPVDGDGWVARNDKPRSRVYAEHEPEHIEKFRRAGFDVVRADKSLDEGIPHVRGLLEQKGDADRPGLLVSDRCVELIQEFQSYKEDHVGSSGDVPDHCFVEGTMVLTETGERPIETIRPGDRVLTRDGYQPVLAAGKTKEDTDVVTAHLTNGRELTGTADHPIHTQDGFKPLLSLQYDDLLTPTPRNAKRCQKLTRSNTKESYSGVTQNQTTSQIGDTTARTVSVLRKASKHCTERFGEITTARSRTDTTSTTWMATLRTTILGILSALARKNTPRNTQIAPSPRRQSKKGSKPPRNGIGRKKGGSGTPNTGNNPWQTRSNPSKRNARCVETRSRTGRRTGRGGSVRTPAKRSGVEIRASMTSKPPAGGVESRSSTTNTRTDSSVRVSALHDTGTEADVYNLTVLGKPEYYANGVLVHNCLDATRYALFTHDQYESGGDAVDHHGSMTDLF